MEGVKGSATSLRRSTDRVHSGGRALLSGEHIAAGPLRCGVIIGNGKRKRFFEIAQRRR
jgi:hypothetical protein